MYMLVSHSPQACGRPALHEQRGLDLSEHAELGYPEFPQNTLYNRDTYNADKARGQELASR